MRKVSASLVAKYKWLGEPDIDPIPENLQEAVNEAEFWLTIHSCILYGLMEGELPNAERCVYYLELGKKQGITPQKGYISPQFILNK